MNPVCLQAKHAYNQSVQQHVSKMSMRDKRSIFHEIRVGNVTCDTLIPSHNIYAGQLAVFQTLNEYARRTTQKTDTQTL